MFLTKIPFVVKRIFMSRVYKNTHPWKLLIPNNTEQKIIQQNTVVVKILLLMVDISP